MNQETIATAADIEQKTIHIIQNGTLDDFIALGIGSSDINHNLSISSSIKIVSRSKKCPFKEISCPTIVILAILCERNDILSYILDNLNPNLSISVNGWYPIHYAACTGDYKCMQTLLKVQYIQEHIEIPIIPSFNVDADPSYYTTALHIAVTNHRHAQVLLLTSPLPDIIYTDSGVKSHTKIPSEFQPANIYQLSLQGNSALHIATKIADSDLVRILLLAGADPELVNKNNVNSIQLANSLGLIEIYEILNTQNIGDTDFYEKYYDHIDFQNMNKDDEEEDEKDTSKISYASKSEVSELQEELNRMIYQIQDLSMMIHELETKNKPETKHVCHRCGALTETLCSTCSEYFCDQCIKKDNHLCNRSS